MKDFDEMILPARRVARTGAERQARRRSGRTPEQVDKERADIRVGVAAHRALCELRKMSNFCLFVCYILSVFNLLKLN